MTDEAVEVLKSWLRESGKTGTQILFPNARGGRLTASGAQYIIDRHLAAACEVCPSIKDKNVSLYTLRHSKAMELLQSGMTSKQVALWLGLGSAQAVQIYVQANLARLKKSSKLTMNHAPDQYHQ